MKKSRPDVAAFKIESFGKTVPSPPLNPSTGDVHSYAPAPGLLPQALPMVDRTYKFYVNGAQARPDAPSVPQCPPKNNKQQTTKKFQQKKK
jgi:hypothetical protein